MTIARIGDKVYDTALHLCGCGDSTLECEMNMDHSGQLCCGCCDHVHTMHTLALYGLLER